MRRKGIVAETARFVTSFLATRIPTWSRYHDSHHTIATVAACRKIGKAERLSSDDLEVVMVAGWFHDTGYTVSAIQHEEQSAAFARGFLTREGYSEKKIRKVLGCIMATKVPQHPRVLRERVICDADMVSLGQKKFLALNELLRQENSTREHRAIDLVAWLRRTDRFLKAHRFHTKYGRTVLERGRQRNLATIQRLLGSVKTTHAIKAAGKTNRKGKERLRKQRRTRKS